jgi:glycosyltransferase involved in cell wall biosynthesis
VFTPQVTEIHSGIVKHGVTMLLRTLAPFTDLLIAVSNQQACTLVDGRVIPRERILTVTNRVERDEILDRTNPDCLKGLGVPGKESRRTIVCQVGRLVPQKNPLFFVKAAQEACAQDESLLFLLIGDGPQRDAVQQEVYRRGLTNRVRLLGYRSDAGAIMAASDIVTLTSRWEGLPYSLIEALALAKPIVATDAPGNRDLVIDGRTGFLVRSPEEMVERVLDLSGSPLLRKDMGESGCKAFEHLFRIDEMVREMEEIYRGLVAQGQRMPTTGRKRDRP